jgi:hypothetical protein
MVAHFVLWFCVSWSTIFLIFADDKQSQHFINWLFGQDTVGREVG